MGKLRAIFVGKLSTVFVGKLSIVFVPQLNDIKRGLNFRRNLCFSKNSHPKGSNVFLHVSCIVRCCFLFLNTPLYLICA